MRTFILAAQIPNCRKCRSVPESNGPIQTADRKTARSESSRYIEHSCHTLLRATFVFTTSAANFNPNTVTLRRGQRARNKVIINSGLSISRTQLVRTLRNNIKRLDVTLWITRPTKGRVYVNFISFIEFKKLTRLYNPCKTAGDSRRCYGRASSRTRSAQTNVKNNENFIIKKTRLYFFKVIFHWK